MALALEAGNGDREHGFHACRLDRDERAGPGGPWAHRGGKASGLLAGNSATTESDMEKIGFA